MLKRVALIAALFALTVEMLRASGPLLDEVGLPYAAVIAVLLFAVPGLLVRHGWLGIVILLFVGMRVAAQIFPILLLVGGASVLGMIALAKVVRRGPDPVTAVVGVLVGGVLDLVMRMVTYTWDPVWHTNIWFLIFELIAVIGFSLTIEDTTSWISEGDESAHKLGRVWTLGAFLALWSFLSPAFATSQSGLSLELTIGVMIGGLVLAIELVRRMTVPGGTNSIPAPDHWIDGSLALTGLLAGLIMAWYFTGPVSLAGVVISLLMAAVLLTRALAATGNRAMWTYGLVWVLPVLLFQLHYDKPLPFDNRYIVLAVGVLLGLAGMGRRRDHPGVFRFGPGLFAPPSTVAMLAALTLLVPFYFSSARPAVAVAERPGAGLRLFSWNIKYGKSLAEITNAIKDSAADVVMLQEVSRGWAIGGGIDVAAYLSRELEMPYYWAPAADHQFGNLLLTRLPVSNVHIGLLPYGQGPMNRSYLRATLSLSDGRSLNVVTTHLTHKKANTPTRLSQISSILAEKPDIIAGDLNFWPTWDELREFRGYQSAQDLSVQQGQWTSPTDVPTNRVDYIFGAPRVAFTDFAVLTNITASDHFPLTATMTLR